MSAIENTSGERKHHAAWEQDLFIKKGGWATFPGTASPNNNVAEACAKMLNELKYPRRAARGNN